VLTARSGRQSPRSYRIRQVSPVAHRHQLLRDIIGSRRHVGGDCRHPVSHRALCRSTATLPLVSHYELGVNVVLHRVNSLARRRHCRPVLGHRSPDDLHRRHDQETGENRHRMLLGTGGYYWTASGCRLVQMQTARTAMFLHGSDGHSVSGIRILHYNRMSSPLHGRRLLTHLQCRQKTG